MAMGTFGRVWFLDKYLTETLRDQEEQSRLNYIYLNGLESVKPEAKRITR